jgi:hypothetical protein
LFSLHLNVALEWFLKGIGQSLGLILIEARTLAQLAGEFQPELRRHPLDCQLEARPAN